MKTFRALMILFVTGCISPVTHAATIAGISGIDAFADTVISASGTFYNWQSNPAAPVPISLSTIEADLTDTNESSFVFSVTDGASIDMAFNNSSIFNGAGFDLVFFFVGENFNFGLDIDAGGNKTMQTFGVAHTGYGVTDSRGRLWHISAAKVDLTDFGFLPDEELVSDFSIFIGEEFRDPSRASLSLIGGFHTTSSVAAVPLPLPILLFTSGLAVLGLFGRIFNNGQ